METKKKHFFDNLKGHLPANSLEYCYDLWQKHQFHLKIVRNRISKLGDYRYDPWRKIHIITINHSLNPYNFLITYIHEIAHLVTYVQYGKGKKPHGPEWKMHFRELIQPLLSETVFPKDVLSAIIKYMANPSASSCSDADLYKALRNYDKESFLLMLSEIHPGEQFLFHKRIFEKGDIRRTKVLCKEVSSGRKYLIPQLALVLRIENNKA